MKHEPARASESTALNAAATRRGRVVAGTAPLHATDAVLDISPAGGRSSPSQRTFAQDPADACCCTSSTRHQQQQRAVRCSFTDGDSDAPILAVRCSGSIVVAGDRYRMNVSGQRNGGRVKRALGSDGSRRGRTRRRELRKIEHAAGDHIFYLSAPSSADHHRWSNSFKLRKYYLRKNQESRPFIMSTQNRR